VNIDGIDPVSGALDHNDHYEPPHASLTGVQRSRRENFSLLCYEHVYIAVMVQKKDVAFFAKYRLN